MTCAPKGGWPDTLIVTCPQLGVHQVERVMVDEGRLLDQVANHAALWTLHVPGRGRCAGDQDQEHAGAHPVRRQVLLGDAVLALVVLAVKDRDAIRGGPRSDPPGEAASHPHQVGVVEVLVVVVVQSPPSDPKTTRAVTEREIGVQDDAVHTVVYSGQQIAIACRQLVTHLVTVGLCGTSRHVGTAPKGPSRRGEVPARCSYFDRSNWPTTQEKSPRSRPAKRYNSTRGRRRGWSGH